MISFSNTGPIASALLRSHGYALERTDEGVGQKTPQPPPFTIAISREVGALGNAVGQELGRRLGWPVYDKEILNRMADEMGRPLEKFSDLDERHVGWLEEILRNLQTEYRISPDTYVRHLVGVVRGLGAIGHCVIVGRAAACILKPATTLRVRLVADLPDRVRVIQEVLSLSEKEAAAYVKRHDPARAEFVKRNFGKDPADAHNYDLVLNTSRHSVAECADLILASLHHFESRVAAVAAAAASATKPAAG